MAEERDKSAEKQYFEMSDNDNKVENVERDNLENEISDTLEYQKSDTYYDRGNYSICIQVLQFCTKI